MKEGLVEQLTGTYKLEKKTGAHIKVKNVPGRRPKQRPSEVETSRADMRHRKKTNVVRSE